MNPFVAGFQPRGHELPGFEITAVRTFQADAVSPALSLGAANLQAAPVELPALPRVTRTFWRGHEHARDMLVEVQTIENASRESAHRVLLGMLGDLQSPALVRRDDLGFGDVVFATPGSGGILFARGNLVFLLRCIEIRARSLLPEAHALDADLMAAPAMLTASADVEVKPAARGEAIPLVRTGPRPAGRATSGASLTASPSAAVSYKAFSRGGDVSWRNDTIVYTPELAGEHDVVIYQIGPGGASTLRAHQRFVAQ